MNSPEMIAGILGLLLSLSIVWATFSLPEFPVHFAGPAFYPRVLAVALAVMSVVMISQAVRSRAAPIANGSEVSSSGEPGRGLMVVMAMVASAIYCGSIELLGFIVTTILYFAFLMFLMQREKRILRTVLWSVGSTLTIYVIFDVVLKASLPMGTIFR